MHVDLLFMVCKLFSCEARVLLGKMKTAGDTINYCDSELQKIYAEYDGT
jgi:hypothetical protein